MKKIKRLDPESLQYRRNQPGLPTGIVLFLIVGVLMILMMAMMTPEEQRQMEE